MHFSASEITFVASATLLLVGSPCAQRQARDAKSRDPVATLRRDGSFEYHFPTFSSYDPIPPAYAVTTGISVPGDISGFSYSLGSQDVDCFLVFGRDSSGNGRIEHWTRSPSIDPPQAPSLSSALSSPGKDYVSGCYDPSLARLYVFEATTKTIQKASWDGIAPIPATGWSTLVADTALPELADPQHTIIHYDDQVLLSRYVSIGRHILNEVTGIKLIDDRVTPPSVTTLANTQWPLPNHFLLAESVKEGASSVVVRVKAGETDTFQLYDVALQQMLGSATAPGPTVGFDLAITSSQPLVLGRRYWVKRQSEPLGTYWGVPCYARYGSPETTNNGIEIHGVAHTPDPCVARSYLPLFAVTTGNAALADSDGSVAIDGVISIALRDTAGNDPVIQIGGTTVLNGILFIPASGLIPHVGADLTEHSTLVHGGAVAIPNDNSLIGAVILHQGLVFANSQYYFSDIVGAMICGPSAASNLRSGGSTSTRNNANLELTAIKAINPSMFSSRYFVQQAVLDRLQRK